MKRAEADQITDSLHKQDLIPEAYNCVEAVYFNKETGLYLVVLSHDERPFKLGVPVRLDNFYVQEVSDVPFCLSDFPEQVYWRLTLKDFDLSSYDRLEDLCDRYLALSEHLRCGGDVISALEKALKGELS